MKSSRSKRDLPGDSRIRFAGTRIQYPCSFFLYLSTCLPVYLSTCLPVYLSTCLPVYLFTYLLVYPLMLIREFDLPRDHDSVIALWRAAAPGVKVGSSDTREALAKKLARDPDLFLVMEHEGQLIGSVIGGFDGRRGMVYHLAVAAEWRGQDLGTALMLELETRLKAKGCRKYHLLVRPDNLGVLAFYRKLGWEAMPMTIMGKEIVHDQVGP